MTKYETYTPSKAIRPDTRKYAVHKVWQKHGKRAAQKYNAGLPQPVQARTVASWCCYWAWEEENCPGALVTRAAA